MFYHPCNNLDIPANALSPRYQSAIKTHKKTTNYTSIYYQWYFSTTYLYSHKVSLFTAFTIIMPTLSTVTPVRITPVAHQHMNI